MRVSVVTFPGSNCDDDVVRALRLCGAEPIAVFHREVALPASDAVVLPGGFSYGDYLRAGAMAAQAQVMAAVRRFADAGGPVLGICNGFQILCEAGLLPGALVRNASLHFECRDVHVRVDHGATPWTRGIPVGTVLRMPIAHAEGRYVDDRAAALIEGGRAVFRYATRSGAVAEEARDNPNGSTLAIAGVANQRGNVVGLMPHPERATDPLAAIDGACDGRRLFDALLLGVRPDTQEVRA